MSIPVGFAVPIIGEPKADYRHYIKNYEANVLWTKNLAAQLNTQSGSWLVKRLPGTRLIPVEPGDQTRICNGTDLKLLRRERLSGIMRTRMAFWEHTLQESS